MLARFDAAWLWQVLGFMRGIAIAVYTDMTNNETKYYSDSETPVDVVIDGQVAWSGILVYTTGAWVGVRDGERLDEVPAALIEAHRA